MEKINIFGEQKQNCYIYILLIYVGNQFLLVADCIKNIKKNRGKELFHLLVRETRLEQPQTARFW